MHVGRTGKEMRIKRKENEKGKRLDGDWYRERLEEWRRERKGDKRKRRQANV